MKIFIFIAVILCLDFSFGVVVPADRLNTGPQNMRKLYEAVRSGDKNSVIRLLQYGAKVDEESPDGNTALMFAADKGNTEFVELLVKSDADVNHVNQNGDSVLTIATGKGVTAIIELLIRKGAKVNHETRIRDTPIMLAAEKGYTEIVNLLIKNGANVNQENIRKVTPLILAAWMGHSDIVVSLINNGANVNAITGDSGDSALILAADKGHTQVVSILIQRGANVNQSNKSGNTALILAADKGHMKIVSLLIQARSNVSQSNLIGNTPLIASIVTGHTDIAQMLIDNGANVSSLDKNNDAALSFASERGFDGIVEKLIQKGANLNQANKRGDSALHKAAIRGQEAIVRLLLKNGAKRNVRNSNGKLPKDLASEKGFSKISQMLSSNASNINNINNINNVNNANNGNNANNVNNFNNGVNTINKKRVAEQACDIYSNTLSNRILGGALAASGEFPWMAALGYLDQSYQISFDCGGTLISDNFVLTAAHCARDTRRPVVVRLGKLTLVDDGGVKAENYQIQEIIRHPDYSAKDKKNDIALIQLVKRVWFTDFIRPACLQTDMRDENSQVSLTVTGWGIVSTEWRNRSKVLQKADLKTVPLYECNRIFLNYNKDKMLASFKDGISESQYCAFDPQHRSDSCEGDSGGPLQIIRSDQVLAKIVGIVSFGVSCGTHLPGIYTRVAYFRHWIESRVWQNGQIAPPLNSESMNI